MDKVLSLDISWFDNNEPAGLAAKLEMDIAQAKTAGVSWCHGVMVSLSKPQAIRRGFARILV